MQSDSYNATEGHVPPMAANPVDDAERDRRRRLRSADEEHRGMFQDHQDNAGYPLPIGGGA